MAFQTTINTKIDFYYSKSLCMTATPSQTPRCFWIYWLPLATFGITTGQINSLMPENKPRLKAARHWIHTTAVFPFVTHENNIYGTYWDTDMKITGKNRNVPHYNVNSCSLSTPMDDLCLFKAIESIGYSYCLNLSKQSPLCNIKTGWYHNKNKKKSIRKKKKKEKR